MKGARLSLAVLDGLAAYRLARFVVTEDAPAAVAVRDWIRGRVPEAWAGAVDCQHCAGLWAALGLGALRGIPGARALAYPLAVGGVASLAASLIELIEETEPEAQGPVSLVDGRGADPQSSADDHPFGWGSGEAHGALDDPPSLVEMRRVGRALTGRAITSAERAHAQVLGDDGSWVRDLGADELAAGRLRD